MYGWVCAMTDSDEDTAAQIVHQWAAAFMSGDPAAVASLYSEDGIWEDKATEVVRGRANIADHLAIGLSYATYAEMEHQIVVVAHDVVVTDWIWSGTSSTHARASSDQTPFSTRGITVFEIDDNLIARGILYYNYDELFN